MPYFRISLSSHPAGYSQLIYFEGFNIHISSFICMLVIGNRYNRVYMCSLIILFSCVMFVYSIWKRWWRRLVFLILPLSVEDVKVHKYDTSSWKILIFDPHLTQLMQSEILPFKIIQAPYIYPFISRTTCSWATDQSHISVLLLLPSAVLLQSIYVKFIVFGI